MQSMQVDPARRGSALIIALIIIVVVAGLGGGYLQVTTAVTRRQSSEVENLQAFYLAEAGLAEAFQAVRMGRTGQVGSNTAPARHGNGLLWVDALSISDEQVRLESTALVGTGRAALALVVEPVETPLGFFSDEDLVVDSVLLVDGFDSKEQTYEEQIGPADYVSAYFAWLSNLVGRERLESLLEKAVADREQGLPTDVEAICRPAGLDWEGHQELAAALPQLLDAYEAGSLDTVPESPGASGEPDASGTVWQQDFVYQEHTDSGGLLGSNGSVHFENPNGDEAYVYGDVIPGPNGSVDGAGAQILGSTDSRTTDVELPEVEVPPVSMQEPVRHDDGLPMLVSSGLIGFQKIEVASDAELILRGPATVVIGSLVLEPGALLTLDTRDGDVEIYITGEGMDLQEGSVVSTSSDYPDETTIQVGAIPSGPDGAPVHLDATSQFHGTIYAPNTEVYVGSDFEIYGGVVAQKLEIGPGAKLHFDNAGFEGTAIPRILSWRIVEVPSEARSRRGDVYDVLGIDPEDCSDLNRANDLSAVQIEVEYVDQGGVSRTYTGSEDMFDWDKVAEVIQLERNPEREQDRSSDDQPPPAQDSVRGGVQMVLDMAKAAGFITGGMVTVDLLIPYLPLTQAEWAEIDAVASQMDPAQEQRLRDEDLAAGGTGG